MHPICVAQIDFVRDVRPIFEKHCYECHGAGNQESGLRLEVKEAALIGGDNHGPDSVPSKPSESPLIRFVTTDNDDEVMPPGKQRLSLAEITILTQWIGEGAVWPDGIDLVQLEDKSHLWSFKPLRVAPPLATTTDCRRCVW